MAGNSNHRTLSSRGWQWCQSTTLQDNSIPISESTAVWLTDIPGYATIGDVLHSITGCGRIWTSNLTPPGEGYFTAAAKLVFTRAAAAQTFLARANSIGHYVLGHAVTAIYNRNRYRECQSHHQSRVLRVWGSAEFVNLDFLLDFFSRFIRFDLTYVDVAGVDDRGVNVIDFHFAAILAQSTAAKALIEKEAALHEKVFCAYMRDPCE